MTLQPAAFMRATSRIRQAVVEAYDLGLEFFDDSAHRSIEWRAVRRRDWRRRIDAEFDIIRFEFFAPRMLARIVRHRRLVRKEIEIDRLVCRSRRGIAPLAHAIDLR